MAGPAVSMSAPGATSRSQESLGRIGIAGIAGFSFVALWAGSGYMVGPDEVTAILLFPESPGENPVGSPAIAAALAESGESEDTADNL